MHLNKISNFARSHSACFTFLHYKMIITLLSDLGTRDPAIPVAKAILMQHVADAALIDISHQVMQYDIRQAAYLLLSAYRSFAKGTVHIIAVDIFAGPAPCMLLAKKDGHYFIAPDNGILPLAFGTELENTRMCYECSRPYSFSDWMRNAGTVITTVMQGWVLPYRKCEVKNAPKIRQHQVTPYGVDCNILYVDRYKNVVLDISRKQFDKVANNRPFSIQLFRMSVSAISTHYNEVPVKEPLCRFNNAGFLEIAVNQGHAATLLGLDSVNTSDLRYQTVRIFF